MIAPELPLDEADRLAELHKYQLLDSAAEQEFDNLTALMVQTFGAPIALISLIDSHRQWFLSRQGLEVCSTSREISFCGHAILDTRVFYVENATQDERFHDNPLVTGEPFIKTYAGAPIISPQGFKLGTACLIFDRITPLTDAQLEQLAGFARLVSDLIEMRLDRLYFRAQQLRLQQLVAVLGHELRTPLVSLKLMQDQAGLDQFEPFGREMVETTAHLQSITEDIEALASGKVKPVVLTRTRPFELIERVMISLKPLLEEHGIVTQLQADTQTNGAAMLDANALRQLVTNLLKNAALHSQASELHLQLHSHQAGDSNSYTLVVADNGRGIAYEDRKRLFAPYERGDSQASGTGLGLAVCRQMAQRVGGSLRIESTPGGGATFVLEFSAKVVPEIDPQPATMVNTRDALRGVRLLLVEDTRMLRILGETLLKGAGAEVTVAENGIEALALMAKRSFDYIISDLIMPGMGGDGLLEQAQVKYPGSRIIILSSTNDQLEIDRMYSLGALAVVSKPIDIRLISKLIKSNGA